MTLTDWIGSAGVFMILLAFFLNLFKYLDINSLTYLMMNFIGAALAGLASVLIAYVPFIVLEGAWATVSLIAILRRTIGKRRIVGVL